MATKFSKDVVRVVTTPDGDLNVTLSADGISICPKGTRRKVSITWEQILQNGSVPDNAPASAEDNQESRKRWFWK